jgi:sucrose-6-phosphate hydrolase SacC (GH32 family)
MASRFAGAFSSITRSIEVFANDRAYLSSRIYPTRGDSLGIALFAQGGEACLETLDAWQMRSMWA